MKIITSLLFFVLLFAIVSTAQTFRVDTSQISFENKLRPCLYVKYDADAKTVKKGWADFLKKNYQIMTKGIGLLSNKDILSAEDVTISDISGKRMNIYARATDVPDGSEFKYFTSFGYDFFIGPLNYNKEFGAMKKLLTDFSVSFLNKYYSDETSAILKQIKNTEKDILKITRQIRKNNKKAEKSSDAVSNALEAKNNAFNYDIDIANSKIENLKKQLEKLKIKQEGIIQQ